MIPMWMTFIMCGVVISIGNTYFLKQAKDINQKVGKWKIPLSIFKLFYDLVKDYFPNLYLKVTKLVIREKYIPPLWNHNNYAVFYTVLYHSCRGGN